MLTILLVIYLFAQYMMLGLLTAFLAQELSYKLLIWPLWLIELAYHKIHKHFARRRTKKWIRCDKHID